MMIMQVRGIWKWNSDLIVGGWGGGGGRGACKSEIDASLAQQVAPKAEVRPHMASTV